MSSALWIILSVGAILVMKGVYDEKLAEEARKTRTVYRFLPRSQYENAYPASSHTPTLVGTVNERVGSMFHAPLDSRTAGRPE